MTRAQSSRGLGLLLARHASADGAIVALLARNEEELARAESELLAKGRGVIALVCDVTRQVDVDTAMQTVLRRFGKIDVLINNAGIIQIGPLEHMTEADFEQTMRVHFWGPLHCINAVLPHMRRRRAGRIANIASIGGEVAVPHLAPYAASKFALVGLSNAVRAEVAKDGIRVTTVVPGLMRTGSPLNALVKGRHQAATTKFNYCFERRHRFRPQCADFPQVPQDSLDRELLMTRARSIPCSGEGSGREPEENRDRQSER